MAAGMATDAQIRPVTPGRVRRILFRVAVAAVTVYAVLVAGLYWAMSQTPDAFGRMMAHVPMVSMLVLPFETLWTQARAGRLQPGDPAPDFSLPALDHSAQVQLSLLRGVRPVVLVFGSYT